MKKHLKFLLILLCLTWTLIFVGCEDEKVTYEDAFNYSEGLAAVKINGKYGFIDINGTVVIDAIYDQASYFLQDYAVVKKGELWGVINTSNDTIIPFEYSDLSSLYIHDYFSAQKGNKYGVININNEVIVDFISSEPINFYTFENKHLVAVYCENNLFGFMDITSGLEVAPKYANIYGISECNMLMIHENNYDNKMGFVNVDTGFILEPTTLNSYSTYNDFKTGFIPILIDGKYGYINTLGEIVIQPIYNEVSSFCNGIAGVGLNGKYGAINTKGEVVLEFIYDYLPSFNNNLATTCLNGEYIVINSKGEILDLPPIQYFSQMINQDIIVGSYIDEYGNTNTVALNPEGEILFNCNYEHIFVENNDLIKVYNGGNTGYINGRGIEIIPVIYDECNSIGESYFQVMKGNKWGVVDRNNKELIPIIYDELCVINGTQVFVGNASKYGIYNLEDNSFSELIYDEFRYSWEPGTPTAVRQGDSWIYLKP